MPIVSKNVANGLSTGIRSGAENGITAGQDGAPGRTRTCDLEIRSRSSVVLTRCRGSYLVLNRGPPVWARPAVSPSVLRGGVARR